MSVKLNKSSNCLFWFVVFGMIAWFVVYLYQVNVSERRSHDEIEFELCLGSQFVDLNDVGREIEKSGSRMIESCRKVAPLGDLHWDYYDKEHFVLVGSEGGALIARAEYNSWSRNKLFIMRQDGFRYR